MRATKDTKMEIASVSDFVQLVEAGRAAAGLSQEGYARSCGMSKRAVSWTECGNHKCGPCLDTCVKMLAALGYRLEAVKREAQP